jgi:hypothetical protein
MAESRPLATASLADRVPQVAQELERFVRTYHRRYLHEVIEPLLADLRALESELQRDFLDSLAIDGSLETVDWYAQNLRTLLNLRMSVMPPERGERGEGGPSSTPQPTFTPNP